jgi:hypothetical protein
MVVHSKVLAPARFSLTMADPTLRDVGQPLTISPALFLKEYLYVNPVSIVKRPGKEVVQVSGNGRGKRPVRVTGTNSTTLDVLTLD